MFSILLRIDTGAEDALAAELWERGTAGIVEETDGLRAFFDDDSMVTQLEADFGARVIEIRGESTAAAPAFSLEDWDGILAGERFFIAPSWVQEPAPAGRIHLTIDTMNAFGTGRHESTQLVLQALEDSVTPGLTVLDVGCGSGILSLAASRLGAGTVVSCDLDLSAVAAAASHLCSAVFRGTIDAVRDNAFGLVVANISTPVIERLSPDLHRAARAGTRLILAGFTQGNEPKGFLPERVLELNGWLCWVCRASGAAAACGDQQRHARSDRERWW